jgi:hypothetical protein
LSAASRLQRNPVLLPTLRDLLDGGVSILIGRPLVRAAALQGFADLLLHCISMAASKRSTESIVWSDMAFRVHQHSTLFISSFAGFVDRFRSS